ncbi:MAG: GTPase Era, partial [Deltaproteobacteria bacterium RIFCSPLOWO2_02_FULL_47_10]
MKTGFVAIIGQPNVGKSTLLNRLIGEELSIVTSKPQTTRQNIVGIYNSDGVQAIFLDTPGFHEAKKPLNRTMIEKIGTALADADIAALVVEPKKGGPDEIDTALFSKTTGVKHVIIVINKIDTVLSEPWGNVVDKYWQAFNKTPTIAVSAVRGDGCPVLLNKIIEFLPLGEAYYPIDQYTEHPVRFLASEIIREQATALLYQELPYSIAVEIEEFKEAVGKGEIVRIGASIIVEKDSQKGIVIGKKGEMIKKIGTAARTKIEALTGTKVFLELFVKVVEGWTKDRDILKRL